MKAIRASKNDVLKFIRRKEIIEVNDLVEEFGYSLPTARNKIIRLEKAGLVEKLGARRGAYCLTSEAHGRLEYYERKE